MHKQNTKITYTKTIDLNFWIYKPEKEKNLPTIIYLTDAGRRGSMHKTYKGSIVHFMPPEFLSKFLIVTLNCPENEYYSSDTVKCMADYIRKNYKDKISGKIFLIGYSLGARGCWQAAVDYPNEFSGIVPIAGYGMPCAAQKVVNLPILCFHGQNDKVVNSFHSEFMIAEIMDNGGKPEFYNLENVGHSEIAGVLRANVIYNWILKHNEN